MLRTNHSWRGSRTERQRKEEVRMSVCRSPGGRYWDTLCRYLASSALVALAAGALTPLSAADRLTDVKSIEDLDRLSVTHFALMSHNKGDSPYNSVEFARMVAWVEAGGAAFVVGLGNHVKHPWENSFIPWIRGNSWWRAHCYLNVADGENEYYSPTHLQSDYGEGAPVLDLVDLDAHAEVVRPNGAEYYARIAAGEYTVHLIQMHYSDQPADPAVAFTEESRAWMIRTLEGIDKGEMDLIIVAAHSRSGSWNRVLSPERRRTLLAKVDLVLSATTHHFAAWVPERFEDGPAVCVNTGAVSYPGHLMPNGYVEVHVLPSGDIVGQFMDLTQTRRQLQHGRWAWFKPRHGRMTPLDLQLDSAPVAPPMELTALSDSVAAAELQTQLEQLLQEMTGADLARLQVVEGLPAGPVTLRDAWRVFGRNRNLRVVRVPAAKVDTLFSLLRRPPAAIGHRDLRVATSHPTVTHIVALTGITHEAIEPQAFDDPGLREVDLVAAWLRRQQVNGD